MTRSALNIHATPNATARTRSPAAALAAVVLSAFGTSAPAWSQAAAELSPSTASGLAEIEGVAASGSREPALIAALMAMGEAYQSEGEYMLAVAAIERAIEIARINYGLYSADQIPLVRQLVENQIAIGDERAAWDSEQRLIELASRNLDDLRVVPILTEVAEKRIGILERHFVGEFPPEIVFGCYYRRHGGVYSGCSSGSLHVVSETLVLEALGYYDEAVVALVRNERGGSQERLAIEQAALRTVYDFADRIFPPIKYDLGKRYLERILSYHSMHSDLLAETEARLQIADWELLYSNHSQARDMYTSAYAALVDEGSSREAIDSIFAPAWPIVLPVSESGWLEAGRAPKSKFFDIEFDINRYGKGKRIEFLDTSTSVSRAERNRLERTIATSRFRPRATDGRFDADSRVLVRYFVEE